MSQYQQYHRLAAFVDAAVDLNEALKQDLARDGFISDETIKAILKYQQAHKSVETMLELVSDMAGKAN